MKKLAAALVLLAVSALPAAAGEAPTKPIRFTWIATSCANWNCAAAALVLANGDRHVIVLPTGHDARPWVVLRRVEEGSLYVPEEEIFGCEIFDSVTLAAARFASVASCRLPIILSVPDGRAIVVSLNDCGRGRQRAVR